MNKIKIIFISITVFIVMAVLVLVLKNYFPDNAISVKAFPDNKYITKEMPMILKSKKLSNKITVTKIIPKQFDSLETQIKAQNLTEPRMFDDVMKAAETFSPLVVPFITFYLYKKKKKIDKNVKDDGE
jgi:hypothetical protein